MLNRLARRAVSSSSSLASSASGSRAYSRMPFLVHRGALTAPSDPIHENQRVECSWTVRRDDHRATSGPPRAVQKLKLLAPGLTIVRVRPELWDAAGDDAVVARVRVSSSSADVLRGVQVTSLWPDRTLVDFRLPHIDRRLFGHLVTEIDLPHANAVRSLAAIGLGDVVVGKDVLYAGGGDGRDDDEREVEYRGRGRSYRRRRSGCGSRADARSLQLLAANESRLFVDASATDMQLESLKVGAMGTRSHVAMDIGALDLRGSLELGVAGGRDGGVSISMDSLIASRLRLAAIGDGELELAVRRHLELDDLKTLALGRGYVHVQAPEAADSKRPVTRARTQSMTTIGSACVDTSTVPSERTTVATLGSNDLRLQTRHALRVRSVGSSVVECVDRLPTQLDVRGFPSPTLVETPPIKQQSAGDHEPTDRPAMRVPTAEDAFQRESLLLSPRSNLLSRLLGVGQRKRHDWHGSGKTHTTDDGSESDGSGSASSRRPRHRDAWAADRWM